MTERPVCKTCGGKLIKRETQRKASQLRQAYYYTAYYFCPNCGKIYHDERFKVVNKVPDGLWSEDFPSNTKTQDLTLPSPKRRGNDMEASRRRGEHGKEFYDVEIWTDGACVFNGHVNARAAWAFVSGDSEKAGLVSGPKQTNNVAEGLAVLEAIRWAAGKKFKNIKIYSDSQITINNMRKPVSMIKQNRGIFEEIEKIVKENGLSVVFEKVLGHSGDVNNSRADRLANQLAGKR